MKATRLHTIVTTAAALVLLSGVYVTAPAGPRVKRSVTRNVEVTSSVPALIVDDTPINPDTAGKIKPKNGRKMVKQANNPPTRKIKRR